MQTETRIEVVQVDVSVAVAVAVPSPQQSRHPRGTCRHCQTAPINRPRALCWNCYYAPGVKDLYPSTSPMKRGNGLGNKPGRLPAEPTDAQPGSERKIRVMEQRAARGEAIFHPDDNVCL